MQLVVEPDIYQPSIDEAGNYIDKIPCTLKTNGLSCPCGSRKDKTYDSFAKFRAHIQTKVHQKWLEGVNANRANYLVECISLRETVKTQQIIIAQMQRQLDNFAKAEIVHVPLGDLLNFD